MSLDETERTARMARLQELIDLMAESVRMDGGDLELVAADVDSGRVEVRLSGACSSCAISTVTMEEGVRRVLTERLDWVTEVVGQLDDSLSAEESEFLGRGAYVPRPRS
jgi:Fe-S cluster biogenesis protein NfuA